MEIVIKLLLLLRNIRNKNVLLNSMTYDTQDGYSEVRIPTDPAGNGIFPESFRPVPLIFPRENRRKVESVFRTGFPRT
jgi:hypothetical protein